MRPRHQATLMQPLQCDLQIPNCKTQKNYAQRREKLQLQNRMDLGTKPKKNHPCSHYNAICIQNIKGELSRVRSKRSKPHPAHTRGTFPSPAAATWHGKAQGFVLRLPPQNKPHPTVMQPPLQCVLRQHDHDHLTPPGGEKCNIHVWSATMPGFVTLALYHIYPHICRLSYPKS